MSNYTFKDASGNTQTAAAASVASALYPQIQIVDNSQNVASVTSYGEILVKGSVVSTGTPASVSGVGVFNVNHVGSGSIVATLSNSSVAVLQGTNPWTISNSSVMLATGINTIGSVTAIQGTNPWTISNSSVMLATGINMIGSVAAIQSTNPWHITGSVLSVSASGSSIVGTYSEDATHATTDKGIFTLGVRNDTVASLVSADLDYAPRAVDSAGRTIIKMFAPDHASVFGVGSVNGAASVILIGAPGAGLRNYITDIMVANTGATTTLVRFTSGGASILGYTIAPTGGGSNMIGFATPMVTHVNSPFNLVADTATSVLYGTAYGYKAP